MIDFLYDKPAIILDKKILVIADLHLSAEKKLVPYGDEIINLTERMLNEILSIVKGHKIKKVIILGDVKESLFDVTPEILFFFSKLSEKLEEGVEVVKGNHDANLEAIPDVKIHPSSGIVYKNIGLAHGHAWPDEKLMQCSYVILAHQHAHVVLEDKKGKKYYQRIFLKSKINIKNAKKKYKKVNKDCKLILIPSFNPILTGMALNKQKKALGPLFRNKVFKMNSSIIYTLKGICLGQLNRV